VQPRAGREKMDRDVKTHYDALKIQFKDELYFGDCVSEHTTGEILGYKSRGDAVRKNQNVIKPKFKRHNRRFYSLEDIARFLCNQ
jgi:hypothetical protein